MTHAEAIEIIRNGGPCVRLLVRRGGRVPPLLPGGKLLFTAAYQVYKRNKYIETVLLFLTLC